MTLLVVLPVLLPLTFAAAGLAAWRSAAVQQALGIAGAGCLAAASLVLAVRVAQGGPARVQIGNWPAPFGISLAADGLSSLMVLLGAVVGLAVMIFAVAEVAAPRRRAGFFPLALVVLAGVEGAFLTGDLFNLYVCFEVMLMASFVLLSLGGERPQLEGALAYVALNLLSSALFLAAAGMIYGVFRTLNLAELAQRVPLLAADHPQLVAAMGGLLLVAFGIKAALFPLFAWLPASYHTPSVSVSALFAGLLTKVGVYAMLRIVPTVLAGVHSLMWILLCLATVTMVVGVIGAVAQPHVRRILGFHIVSQIGYIVFGLALIGFTEGATRRLALAAAIFYVAHHILVKTNLFLISGLIRHVAGGEELSGLGSLARRMPWLALLFAVPALSLAGVPPLSGFWAKLAVLRVGLEAGAYLPVAAALLASLLTLVSMMKIWNEAFWKAAPEGTLVRLEQRAPVPLAMTLPVLVLAIMTVAIGLAPGPLLELSGRAAEQVLSAAAGVGAALPGELP